MHTPSFAEYMRHIRAGDWDAVGELMLGSAQILATAGADFAISPDNTIHQAYPEMVARSPIPWIHIAEAVGRAARARGFTTLGILGTKYLMNSRVYPDTLDALGLGHEVPQATDQDRINAIIFTELVQGQFTAPARRYFNEVVARLKARGCDAVVLGCTEIPLLVDPAESPLPTLDSTRLLAQAAIHRATVPTVQKRASKLGD